LTSIKDGFHNEIDAFVDHFNTLRGFFLISYNIYFDEDKVALFQLERIKRITQLLFSYHTSFFSLLASKGFREEKDL